MDAAGLHLIDLDQPLPGQRRFISCWARLEGPVTYVVDPGPPRSAGELVATLRARGLRRLDYVLLTHVHLDHAGGVAQLCTAWPGAKVVCHPAGRPHLVEPWPRPDGDQRRIRPGMDPLLHHIEDVVVFLARALNDALQRGGRGQDGVAHVLKGREDQARVLVEQDLVAPRERPLGAGQLHQGH